MRASKKSTSMSGEGACAGATAANLPAGVRRGAAVVAAQITTDPPVPPLLPPGGVPPLSFDVGLLSTVIVIGAPLHLTIQIGYKQNDFPMLE